MAAGERGTQRQNREDGKRPSGTARSARSRRRRPASPTHCGHSKIYVLDSEFRRDHDRPQPIGDRSWTSGIGCEASASVNTRRLFRENDIDTEVLPS